MFNLGEYQTLEVTSIKSSGFYLSVIGSTIDYDILLPGTHAPEGLGLGDRLEVFIYRDTKDRLMATTKKPALTLGRLALLEVMQVDENGAFLAWGLEKDLFLPFAEQTEPVKKGEKVLVRLYIDKSQRLAATTRVQRDLKTHPPYKEGEAHDATVLKTHPDIGLFVAVEDLYEGLVLKQELLKTYTPGERLVLYVARSNPAGQLQMSFKKTIPLQIQEDTQMILDHLKDHAGTMSLTDKSSPDDIRRVFNLSKKAFKRALGKLYREGAIEIHETAITLKDRV
ncbi:MAG: hypothetical protein AVO33_05770 [delta proteobacterium ML8_F1]|nr:MAG: hypothetical protein AVO33_05770 [delta proteobacterium ML8_F1]